MSQLKLEFVLQAVDKATATVTKINRTIDRLTEPAKRVRAAFTALLKESRMDRVQAAMGMLGERVGGLTGKLGAVAAGVAAVTAGTTAAVFGFKQVADQVDGIADSAKLLSMTTQRLQQMGYAAQMAGSSQDEMSDALRFLNRNIAEAIAGNKEAAAWFARVGLSVHDLRKMKPDEVFERIADKFKQVGDEGNNSSKKIALMQALLGRSGSKLKQVLDMGSAGLREFYAEADRLGVVLDDATVNAMGDFNDTWDKMRLTVFGAAATALAAMSPVLQDIMNKVVEWTAANRGAIATGFAQWVDRVVDRLPAFANAVGTVIDVVVTLVSVADQVARALGGWEVVIAVVTGVLLGNLAVALATVSTALYGVAAAFLATPFGWFAAGAAGIVVAGVAIYENWDRLEQMFSDIWTSFIDGIEAVVAAMPEWLTDLLGGGAPKSVDINVRDGSGAGAGAVVPSALGPSGAGKTEVGGTLKITIDSEGRPKVSELKKAPWSPMNMDVGYTGGPLAFGG